MFGKLKKQQKANRMVYCLSVAKIRDGGKTGRYYSVIWQISPALIHTGINNTGSCGRVHMISSQAFLKLHKCEEAQNAVSEMLTAWLM